MAGSFVAVAALNLSANLSGLNPEEGDLMWISSRKSLIHHGTGFRRFLFYGQLNH